MKIKLTTEHLRQLTDLLEETITPALAEDFDWNFSKQDTDSDDFDDEKWEAEVDAGSRLAAAYLIKELKQAYGL